MGTTTDCWPPDRRGVPHSYTLFCPPLVTSPRIARDFVGTVLRSLGHDEIVEDARLCTSELTTNAVQHATGTGSLLWLAIECGQVRVTVYDGSRVEPVVRRDGGEAETGRGLPLIAALADAWGTTRGAPLGLGGGKGVWFTLALKGGRGTGVTLR